MGRKRKDSAPVPAASAPAKKPARTRPHRMPQTPFDQIEETVQIPGGQDHGSEMEPGGTTVPCPMDGIRR